MIKFITLVLILCCNSIAFSQESSFVISSIKGITPNVDRYFDQRGNAFATLFCREDSATVMIVDNGPLDGKNFFFESTSQCEVAKNEARSNLNRCKVELIVETTNSSAQIISSNCKN